MASRATPPVLRRGSAPITLGPRYARTHTTPSAAVLLKRLSYVPCPDVPTVVVHVRPPSLPVKLVIIVSTPSAAIEVLPLHVGKLHSKSLTPSPLQSLMLQSGRERLPLVKSTGTPLTVAVAASSLVGSKEKKSGCSLR